MEATGNHRRGGHYLYRVRMVIRERKVKGGDVKLSRYRCRIGLEGEWRERVTGRKVSKGDV